ncbi:MAG: ATP-binding protein [Candidatus Accumulibacter sp. UW20]|jgi:ABC-type cobalamin/Fe3+-siderophores transport system ATPase subunit
MKKRLRSVHVKRFKGMDDAPFDVSSINVFIGANNSGKSTLAQLVHFGMSILQAIQLADRWGNNPAVSLSLNPTQLLYSPCVDLYALGRGGRLLEPKETAIELSLVLSDGQSIRIEIRRGRNGNIHVQVENTLAAKELASLEEPFTIYSPGLAGISRSEVYISNGVLLRTIARGDANLVLRNILYRLSNNAEAWEAFQTDLRELFSNVHIDVEYNEHTDEHIMVYADTGTGRVPIELAGTGVLQAVQILGYVQYFHPSVIILDEPDSHLHPNNQRLLCKLLQVVAEERDTQVFLTTHSRHVVDALSGQASFLWVRNGTVEPIQQDHDLAVLLDIGALDVKEMLSQSEARCIVLTEDELKRGLEVLLEASNMPVKSTLVLAYYGCTTPHNLRPLLELIRTSNVSSKIIVHRDRDYLTSDEAKKWEETIQSMGAEPFLTDGVDVESHYLNIGHLSTLNSKTNAEIQVLLDKATADCRTVSVEKYVNGRTDIEKKSGTFGKLNIGQLAAKAPDIVDGDIRRYRHAKSVLKSFRHLYQEAYGQNANVVSVSPLLKADRLVEIAKKIPSTT